MTAVIKRWKGGGDNGLHFYCPGCKEAHTVTIERAAHPVWQWNGDVVKPTLSPSILVTAGHYMPQWRGPTCYCNTKDPDGDDWGFKCFRCHSFVRDGRIQFLDDCTHELKGQTVDLPPYPHGDE